MCRSIKTLFNFEPAVTDEEIRAASDEIAAASKKLLDTLETSAPPRNREEEAAKARARAAERYGA